MLLASSYRALWVVALEVLLRGRWRSDFIRTCLLHLDVQETAVSDQDGPAPILVLLGVLLVKRGNILVSAELKVDPSSLGLLSRRGCSSSCLLKQFEGLLVPLSEVALQSPHEWIVLAGKELAAVRPASDVHLFGVDLIRNIDEHHVEVVVRFVVGLEDYLDRILRLGRDRARRGNKEERPFFRDVVDAGNLGDQIEIDWETAHVFDLEALLGSFSNKNI